MAHSLSPQHRLRTLHVRPCATSTTTTFSFLSFFLLSLVIVPFATVAAAAGAQVRRSPITADPLLIPFPAATVAPIQAETLVRDSRIPVLEDDHWLYLSEQEATELRKRDGKHDESIGTVVTTATSKTRTSAATASPLPSPFDSSLASNFSGNDGNGACPAFINSFLTNPTFRECYPFSLLLLGSKSFFDAEKSLVSITQVLDASCAANVTFCSTYLTNLAANLTKPANCGEDYELGNSIVVQAYLGMISYEPLYQATCLKNPNTGLYCFANAVTNLTTPSNVYFYYLPLNISLPGSSIPSCSWCLEETMAVFQAASANRKQPIANTYLSAAQQVDTICGPGFANDTLPTAVTSGAGPPLLSQSTLQPWILPSLFLAVAAGVFL